MKNKTKSGVAGVYPYNGSWQVSVSVNGKEIYLGIYDTISEAAEAKEQYLAIHKRERKVKAKTKSGIIGIYPYNNQWKVQLRENNKDVYLGVYDTIEEAKAAKEQYLATGEYEKKSKVRAKSGIEGISYDRGKWQVKARAGDKKIYLGTYKTIEEAKAAKEQYLATGEGKNRVRAKSGIKGIYQFKDRWQVQIRKNGKNISLGVYDTIEEAKAAKEKYLKDQKDET